MHHQGHSAFAKGLLLPAVLLVTATLSAQSFKFTGVNPSKYPIITATMFPLDSNGHRLHPDSADISIREEGHVRRVISITCPDDTVSPISAVLTIDVSGSMQFGPGGDTTHPANMTTAKAAARAWVRWLPVQVSECALTSFDQDNYLNSDFTSDTAKLNEAIDKLKPQGGTDYNKALFNPFAGALQVSKKAQHPAVIVFLTDGLPNQPPHVDSIVAEARAQHCIIYAVTIGLPAPQCLYDITSQTGGACYSNVQSPEAAMEVYRSILLNSGTLGPPCELKWESGPECGYQRYAAGTLVKENIFGGIVYSASPSGVAALKNAPASMHIYNKPPGVRFDTTIFFTAVNATFTITGIACTNPAYSVKPDSMVIRAGDTGVFTLSYVPPDSGYTWTRIDVTADPCPITLFASGGYCGMPPIVRGLQVVNPNGGDDFDAGQSAPMSWDGMSPDDPVIVDYTIDSGRSWIPVSSQAVGWSAWWRASADSSTRCWMRTQHFDDCGILQRDTSDRTWTISIPKLAFNNIYCGDAIVGTSKDTMIFGVVFNPGFSSLTIDSITFAGLNAGDFALASATFPIIVSSSQWLPMEFRFSPSAKGLRQASIVFHCKDTTVTRTISGNGVLPFFTFLTNGIDFGRVFVGEHRDTIGALTVRYNGDKPLWIIDARIGTPNDTDFTLLTPVPAHAMLNGDSMRVDVRFLPSFQGRTSSRLIIRYDGPNSPLAIPLFGEGIFPAGISTSSNNTPELTCAGEGIDSVRLVSTGKHDLEIYSVDVSGLNASDFVPPAPFTRIKIPPGDSGWILLRFKPTSIGNRTATLTLHSNARIDSVFNVTLNARKDSVGFSVDVPTLDAGLHCPGDPVTNGIPVTNTGTVPITVSATIAGGPPVRTTVQPGAHAEVFVDFTAPQYEGTFAADVMLQEGTCGASRQVHITGASSLPHVAASNVLLDAAMSGSTNEDLTLTNSGTHPWTIATLPVISPFVWINPPSLPVTVLPNAPLHLSVGYTPVSTAPVTIPATIFVEPCNVPVVAQLNGTAGYASAALSIRSGAANVGETVGFPIVLNNSSYITQSHAKYFSVQLRYRALLLAPVGSTPEGYLDGNDRVIDLRIPVVPDANHVLATPTFVATLCADTVTTLHLESASADVGTISLTTVDGRFALTGLCHSYGTRLINPNGQVYLQSLRPNPANDNASVDISTIETGRTQLTLIDMMGREVARMIDGEVKPGITTVPVPTQHLPSGMYELILQTPTTRSVLQLGVTH